MEIAQVRHVDDQSTEDRQRDKYIVKIDTQVSMETGRRQTVKQSRQTPAGC